MGESTTDLRNRQAGTFGLNDFISQGDGKATIGRLLKTLLPVVDLRDFQRRYEFIPGEQAVAIGERVASVRFIVPANQFWRPLTLMYRNPDSATHVVQTQFTMYNGNTPSIVAYRMTRTQLPTNSEKIIYGQDLDGGINSIAGYASRLPVIMEPSDVFSFEDLTNAIVATTQEWLFIYEIVPGPATELARGSDGLVTVT